MASDHGTPSCEAIPTGTVSSTTTLPIFQKHALEDAYTPSVSSLLNPDPKLRAAADDAIGKPVRAKKDGAAKRGAKGGTPDPAIGMGKVKGKQTVPLDKISPARYKLPPPKPDDYLEARVTPLVEKHSVVGPDGKKVEFFEATDHVFNKRGYHYTRCIADPLYLSQYHHTEPPPYGPRMSIEDSAMHIYFDPTCLHVTTDKGFRTSKANVFVREGRWFWEIRVTKGISRRSKKEREKEGQKEKDKNKDVGGPHVRVGFARREASLDAPVGFDTYSYGIRDKEGHKVHMSRPKQFFPPGVDLEEGDILGMEIYLPSEALHRKIVAGTYNPAVDSHNEVSARNSLESAEAGNIVRDRIPIRFKSHLYFEQIDYYSIRELEDLMNPAPTGSIKAGALGSNPVAAAQEAPNPHHPQPAMRTLPGSYIKIYKNGVTMGIPFENLLCFLPPASKPMSHLGAREGLDDGTLGYYPAVSVFRNGAAEVNFGPNFKYPPQDYQKPPAVGQPGWKDKSEMLKVLRPICERLREQIVEDTVYDVIDEVDFWLQDGGKQTVAVEPAQGEIKELVQDIDD